VKKRIALWLVFFLGVATGRCSYYELRQKEKAVSDHRAARLAVDLMKARMAAGVCQGIIAHHWSHYHQTVPGSAEVAATAASLEQAFSQPPKEEE